MRSCGHFRSEVILPPLRIPPQPKRFLECTGNSCPLHHFNIRPARRSPSPRSASARRSRPAPKPNHTLKNDGQDTCHAHLRHKPNEPVNPVVNHRAQKQNRMVAHAQNRFWVLGVHSHGKPISSAREVLPVRHKRRITVRSKAGRARGIRRIRLLHHSCGNQESEPVHLISSGETDPLNAFAAFLGKRGPDDVWPAHGHPSGEYRHLPVAAAVLTGNRPHWVSLTTSRCVIPTGFTEGTRIGWRRGRR